MALKVEWVDYEREPKMAPNPIFPKGKDIDGTMWGFPSCKTDLPYPAKRCGAYIVTCGDCELRVGVTTAGRPDDPRSLKINCMRRAH